jgi:tRNA G18 (ribose-2'-O)-methylase SpoU
LRPAITIKDISDPRISPYRSLKGRALERDGLFIAEGPRVVAGLLKSGIPVISCLATEQSYRKFKPILSRSSLKGVPIYIAKRQDVERIIGFSFHQGLMAAARLPQKRSIDKVMETSGAAHFLVALNGVNDPENVGLIVRSAAAFGVDALIVDSRTYNPYYRRAVRVSMGSLFGLGVAYEDDLALALRRLKRVHKTRIIAASPGAKNRDIAKVDLSGNICLVFGNEDKGLSPEILRAADQRVRIPISKDIDSLNVACASAIFLHRAASQR